MLERTECNREGSKQQTSLHRVFMSASVCLKGQPCNLWRWWFYFCVQSISPLLIIKCLALWTVHVLSRVPAFIMYYLWWVSTKAQSFQQEIIHVTKVNKITEIFQFSYRRNKYSLAQKGTVVFRLKPYIFWWPWPKPSMPNYEYWSPAERLFLPLYLSVPLHSW